MFFSDLSQNAFQNTGIHAVNDTNGLLMIVSSLFKCCPNTDQLIGMLKLITPQLCAINSQILMKVVEELMIYKSI